MAVDLFPDGGLDMQSVSDSLLAFMAQNLITTLILAICATWLALFIYRVFTNAGRGL